MRNIFKAIKRAVAVAVIALAGFAGVGSNAYAVNDDFLFGYTFGSGSQNLVLNNGEYTLQATTIGWSRSDGDNNAGLGNYIVGDCANCGGHTFRNYFVFDLSSVNTTITSAYLSLYNPIIGFEGNAKTFLVHEVTSLIPTLLNSTLATYNGIGAGTVVGSTFADSTSNDTDVIVNLSALAVNAINSFAGEQVAFGGTIAVSAVPVPAALPMMGAALAGLFGVARKRKSEAA